MRVVVIGAGAVGRRAVRGLLADALVDHVVVADPDPQARLAMASSGATVVAHPPASAEIDVAVLCGPSGTHVPLAAEYVSAGLDVVSTADDVAEVRDLLDLDHLARSNGARLVVGAGFAPGVSCLLARLAARGFEVVDEIHVAKVGTGGPACARQHHRAFKRHGFDYRDGAWIQRPGGSGRELVWFPAPVDGHDCYRAALPDVELLVPAFPGVSRATARMAATRRDRLTQRLPMLRTPHPEGLVGAVRVEVRGTRAEAYDMEVVGVVEAPATATALMAVVALHWAATGRLREGAAGLAEVTDPVQMCRDLMTVGLRFHRFEGLSTARP